MGRWKPLLLYLPVGLAAVLGSHYYLWARLVRDVGLPRVATLASTATLCVLAVSIPVGIVASRLVSTRWSRWWMRPVYVWIGAALFLVLSLAAMDGVRLVLAECAPIVGTASARARVFAGASLVASASLVFLALREGKALRVERVEASLAKLPSGLDGFRIVQLSDLHVGPTLGRSFIERVVEEVNGLRPDVVAVTGDLVDASVEDLARHVAPLADLVSTYGTFFVTGNHEYHAGAEEWCEHLRTLGVRVLRNEHVVLERGGGAVLLAGIDDYESASFGVGHRTDLAGAVSGRDPDLPLILLAHQPKAVHEAVRHGVDLQLSGHTHGGQLWPLSWILRTHNPLVAGLHRVEETLVYVSRGTGHSGPPMRLGVPAEITDIRLRAIQKPTVRARHEAAEVSDEGLVL